MNSQQVIVNTNTHDYPINIFDKIDNLSIHVLPYIRGKHILIVTTETLATLYLDTVLVSLSGDNLNLIIHTVILPDGEAYKNQQGINKIYDVLIANHYSRDCTLIALGGGVVGDMTGFAAASYMRGVDFIQMPTTLLAQVDSSVGGKTGINHPLGKNMIGAFWQPKLVLADMSTLATLPEREFSAGLAEVIKYGFIMDCEFLSWLELHMENILKHDTAILGIMVKKCCEFKAQIVKEDERESGRRAILNFGHTFGHVIETHMGYGTWLHGEAIAVGMLQAAKLSQILGWIPSTDVTRIKNILLSANLPIVAPDIPVEKSLELMSHDKKSMSGTIRLVLLQGLGNATVTSEFDVEQLRNVL